MRRFAWCLAAALCACGKSESEPTPNPADADASAGAAGSSSPAGGAGGASAGMTGAGATSGASGSATAGAESGGGAGAISGAAGPSAAKAGSGAESGGGAGSTADGEGGAAGVEAQGGSGGAAAGGGSGNPGASGSGPMACENFSACGCGCCSALRGKTLCYYPERGDTLDAVKTADASAAASPDCENATCVQGTRHVCCEVPGVENGATYAVSIYRGGTDHLQLLRTSADSTCTLAMFQYLAGMPSPHPLEVPEGWSLQDLGAFGDCNEPFTDANVHVGVMGWLRRSTTERCALDFDFTAFFWSDQRTVEAVRFAAEAVPAERFGDLDCD